MSRTYAGSVKIGAGAGGTKRQTVIVGLDFGTTFSGVAYATTGDPNTIRIVTEWPTDMDSPAANAEDEKTPTALRFSGTGIDQQVEWGATIVNDKDALQWFKLLLANDGPGRNKFRSSPHVLKVEEQAKKLEMQPIPLIAAYLRKLWEHAVESIIKGAGSLQNARLHLVMTVPAIWSDLARDEMRKAAEEAGICKKKDMTIEVIAEPEAAAMAVLRDLAAWGNLAVGDTFVVVDCGGGTVDLISYKVTKLNPLTVEEVAEGDGDLCGAKVIDSAFEALFRAKLGEEWWQRLSKERLREILETKWEHGAKRTFCRAQNRGIVIEVPPECWINSQIKTDDEFPKITMTPEEIKEIFDTALSRIFELLNDQMQRVEIKHKQLPKYIMLVGGFGRCKYLYEKIKEHVAATPIEVLQSKDDLPWTAICRGAVIHGLTEQKVPGGQTVNINSRIARVSYGICHCEEKGRRPKMDLMNDTLLGRPMAKNQMKWLLRKGNKLSTKKPVQGKFYIVTTKKQRPTEHIIYMSRRSPPPPRLDPTHVERLCVVKFDKEKTKKIIKFDDLDAEVAKNGETIYTLEFDYCMTFQHGWFQFAVHYQGQPVGEVNRAIIMT